jgi:hypothetical protein
MGEFLGSRRSSRSVAVALAVSALLVAATPASADIGVSEVSPRAGVPGRSVHLTIACGACLATYVVNGPAHPPASLPVSLTPVRKGDSEPRRPSTFLGWAKPAFRERDLEAFIRSRRYPEYQLRFEVPAVDPGRYGFAFCRDCSITGTPRWHQLRVLDQKPVAERESEAAVGDWIAVLAVIGAVGFLGALLLGSRRT